MSPEIMGFIAFVCVYIIFFVLKVLADIFIFVVAVGAGFVTVKALNAYPETHLLAESFGISLPPNMTDEAMIIVTMIIASIAALICIPILPFSSVINGRQVKVIEKSSTD